MKSITPVRGYKRTLSITAFFCLMVSFAVAVRAASATDGATPLALQPGTPAGSFALSGFDNVNPYNGAMNFHLTLLNMLGRGGAGYTMTLPIEQKWRVDSHVIYRIVFDDGGGPPLPDPQVSYQYIPTPNWWSGIKPGMVQACCRGEWRNSMPRCALTTVCEPHRLTRFTFTARRH